MEYKSKHKLVLTEFLRFIYSSSKFHCFVYKSFLNSFSYQLICTIRCQESNANIHNFGTQQKQNTYLIVNQKYS